MPMKRSRSSGAFSSLLSDVPGDNAGNKGPHPACGAPQPPSRSWQAGRFDAHHTEIGLFQVWQNDNTF